MTALRPVRLQLSRRKGFDLEARSREGNDLFTRDGDAP